MLTLTAIIVLTGCATARAASDHATALKQREHRQTMTLHRVAGTIRFFGNHPWLLKYGSEPQRWTARRELKRARVWLPIIRRELAETRAALKPRNAHPPCERELLDREGGMNPHSRNPSSGAYGGPQALPGEKMSSAGPDWRDNIWTQIRWMRGYVEARWGGMCNALAHSYSVGWY